MSIDQITVLGAGTMGHGIAINAATAGYHVTLHDVSPRVGRHEPIKASGQGCCAAKQQKTKR